MCVKGLKTLKNQNKADPETAKKQVPYNVSIENEELLHECFSKTTAHGNINNTWTQRRKPSSKE